jgi:hypothetical protein
MFMNRILGLALAMVGLAIVTFVWVTVEAPSLAHDVDLGMAWGPLIQGVGLVALVVGVRVLVTGNLSDRSA